MNIEIRDLNIENISGTSKRTQKPYSFNKQEGWLHQPDKPYPVSVDITLEDNASAYPKGIYKIDERSFYVDSFNRLSVGRLLLKKIGDLKD